MAWTFFESSCNLAVANAFVENGRSGMRMRNSWDIGVRDNAIVRNKLGGDQRLHQRPVARGDEHKRDLVMDPYVPLTTFTAVRQPDLSANGKGIKAAALRSEHWHKTNFAIRKAVSSTATRPFEGHVCASTGTGTCWRSHPHAVRSARQTTDAPSGRQEFLGENGMRCSLPAKRPATAECSRLVTVRDSMEKASS